LKLNIRGKVKNSSCANIFLDELQMIIK